MMLNIDIKSVICSGCNMIASLDDDALCEFCRRDPVAAENVARQIGARYALMIVLAVVAFAIIVFGIVTSGAK